MADVNEASSLSATLNIPHVNAVIKPYIGQLFSSLDDIFNFYTQYAKEGGFGVRKGCKAKISVTKDQGASPYKLSAFVEGHNHALTTPDHVHLLRSHRNVCEGVKSLAELVSSANIPTHRLVSLLELESGGIQNIGCIEKDIKNYKRDLHEKFKGHDANLLNEHFLSEQEDNSKFIFSILADDKKKLTHCFWEDLTSRRAYGLYGDVVVFDTTYNTNRYGMIFAPLMGVNNHFQTIIFGCAFLPDETSESFIWLFEEWMKAMPGGPPKMIITNQDPAMEKAIVQALPTTLHRNCIWHILMKFPLRVGPALYQQYYAEFQDCIWNPETRVQFDTKWTSLIDRAGLNDKSWIQTMYERCAMWVPVYMNHVFSAGMSSSQRAESSHAFFKRYVSKKNSLMDFVNQFERALSRQRHLQFFTDHKDTNEQSIMKKPLVMEKQMAKIYTRSMFQKFLSELWDSLVYVVEPTTENDNICLHKVTRADVVTSNFREVCYDIALEYAKCSCQKFESEGIICRHILAYCKFKKILYLPKQYIIQRWTKANQSAEVLIDDGRTKLPVGDNMLNGGKEGGDGNIRNCTGCGIRGTSHDWRNFPLREHTTNKRKTQKRR